ncbi:MAG: glycoside hydrolase family 11 protein, partial [Fibromonadales bacterium]|nr:glycoside hydrolase family 11 protein [Fibromonadales bacterium]
MKKLILLLAAFSALAFAQLVENPCNETTPLTGGIVYSTGSRQAGAISGTNFHYERWHNDSDKPGEGGKDPGSMTVYGAGQGGGAAFKAEWGPNSGNFLARAGFQWDETKTYDQYGTIVAQYNYTREGTAQTVGQDLYNYSYFGIYGWSVDPLLEYYIIDD